MLPNYWLADNGPDRSEIRPGRRRPGSRKTSQGSTMTLRERAVSGEIPLAMFGLIKHLSELSGPSAEEDAVLADVERLWRELGVRTERTRTGTLIGRCGGGGPTTLLVAHADESCFLVRSIDPRGFLWLAGGQTWSRSVGVRNWFTVGQRVRILSRSGEIPG